MRIVSSTRLETESVLNPFNRVSKHDANVIPANFVKHFDPKSHPSYRSGCLFTQNRATFLMPSFS